MKLLKYIFPVLIAITIISCSSDDDNTVDPINEVEGLMMVQEISNDIHTIELFTTSGQLEQGYNDITIRIMDKSTNEFVENATFMWMPMMHMEMMSHSCPKSSLMKVEGKETIYNGYIVFQMPENADEGWDLTFEYSINEENLCKDNLKNITLIKFVFLGIQIVFLKILLFCEIIDSFFIFFNFAKGANSILKTTNGINISNSIRNDITL